MMLNAFCPCGSLLLYADCCGVYHAGVAIPSTAGTLMRSRFSAFAVQNAAYVLQSWDETTRPAAFDLTDDPTIWQALEIVKTQKGAVNDTTGLVEFKAYYTLSGEAYVLHERSRFIKRQERWFYVDGFIKAHALIAAKTMQAKNAACACGSGKKFKRCCGMI